MKYVQPIGAAVNAPYIDANPGLGVEGSPVPAAAIEHPQREIAAVITGAGLIESTGDLTQLRQAITKMIQSGQRAVIINNAVFAGAVTGTGKAVYWDSANSQFDLALADGTVKQNCVGFADVANANVYAFGDAVLFAGLTPGARYYLDGTTAGAITVTAPTNVVFVGIARNATEVFVDVDSGGGTAQKQLQIFTCTQASNILTGAFPATSLDYRSATAANGTPVTKANGALTLAIPATSNLGMLLTAQVNRLVWAVAYNAGSPVLCVANIAGGLPMDETGFISPTTIGASSNAANVWYSASAVSGNSPYRIVSFSDVVFITGTGWSNPTLVQPIGGQALASMSSLGYGQTYQDVTGSRSTSTTYYNTTGKPLIVSVTSNANQQNLGHGAYVNGVLIAQSVQGFTTAANQSCLSFVVPPGSSYQVTNVALSKWYELR